MSDQPFATLDFSKDCPNCGPATIHFVDGEMVPHGCDFEPESLVIRCCPDDPDCTGGDVP